MNYPGVCLSDQWFAARMVASFRSGDCMRTWSSAPRNRAVCAQAAEQFLRGEDATPERIERTFRELTEAARERGN